MRKLWEHVFSAIYDPLLWAGERAGMARRRGYLMGQAFESDSFDTVVSTLVICTVDDPRRAIEEIARVLRPGGRLLFLEHVRSDSRRLARWQDRLHRPWHAFAAGCHANRPTIELLRESTLRVGEIERDRWNWMPALVHPLAIGTAER